MRIRDLHELPKLRDGLSHLYLEHGKIEQAHKAIEFFSKEGRTLVPVAGLAVLLLGPGTSITHEAIKTLTDNGCLVNWCGEGGVRFYAQGSGETRKGYQLIRQAELVSDPIKHLAVVRRMYQFRFAIELDPSLTIEQIRGLEGARVRRAYAEASKNFGVPWYKRFYVRDHWGASDTINRALSAANACLNGLCHAAIVSAGYSPGLGFVHTGKQLSFVYDVADLYKADLTIPLAFRMTAESTVKVETRIRHACRDIFHRERLLAHIIDDIDHLLNLTRPMPKRPTRVQPPSTDEEESDFDHDPALPGALWSPADEVNPSGVEGGVNYGSDDLGEGADPLRGELTRWLIEPHPGVFVGHLSGMVRDKLWEKCCEKLKEGGVVQMWSTNNEQRFAIRTFGNTGRRIVDFDGLKLVQCDHTSLAPRQT